MILFRYLARELAGTLLAVTVVLLMIFLSGRLIRQLADVAAGEMSLTLVLMMLLLRLPNFLELILPLSFFIAILLTYGRLYAESEMTVLTATGLSNNKILGYTFLPAALLTVIVAVFALVLGPLGAQKVEVLFQQQAQLSEFEMLTPGRFQGRASSSRITYAESLSSDKKEMRGVFLADGQSLIVAQTGTQYVSDDTGSRFLELHQGRRYDLTPNSLELTVLDFERYGVKIADQPEQRRRIRKESLNTSELWGSSDLGEVSQLQWRISMIVMVPIITLLAFPLAKVNPRQGRFARLIPAILLYMVYVAALITLTSLIGKGRLNPSIGLWPLHITYLLIGLGLMLMPEWLRRRKVKSL